ncbi:MAG: hypothetical protein ACOCTI_07815 [Phycisphaeraceae bacterium]
MCKNDRDAVYRVLTAVAEAGLDRQSYVLAIGGGAGLDCVGFAAAIAHRGGSAGADADDDARPGRFGRGGEVRAAGTEMLREGTPR